MQQYHKITKTMTHRRNRLSGTLLLAAATVAYGRTHAAPPPETAPDREPTTEWRDRGPEPTVLDIETRTCDNEDFRRALWTGGNLQLTVMSIPIGGEVGLERHADIDQFLRIEEGEAEVRMGDSADRLDFVCPASADHAIFVPAGKWHNIVNNGDRPLKLYSIYAPAEHPHGTVHRTYEEAMAAEQDHH